MKLTVEEKALFADIDQLIPEQGFLEYNFNDEKQYQFALMLLEKSLDRKRYPGTFKKLELLKAQHQQIGFTLSNNRQQDNGWHDMVAAPVVGANQDKLITAETVATVVGGFIEMHVTTVVKNNNSGDIVAMFSRHTYFDSTVIADAQPFDGGSPDPDVTAYSQALYTTQAGQTIRSGIVKNRPIGKKISQPIILAPVKTTNTPYVPGAINIGLGRRWDNQGPGTPFDYAWNEPVRNHPIGKIPFVGRINFDRPIRTPLSKDNLRLEIFVVNVDPNGGGAVKLSPTDLDHVYSKFSIDPNSPNTLTWNLPPGKNTSDPGDPITFGSVTWPSDMKAYFVCTITVNVENEAEPRIAYTKSRVTSQRGTPREGVAEIEPIAFIWHCLGEGTMVTMEDGSLKPIEYVLAGDRVKSNSQGECATVVWTNKGLHTGSVLRIQTDQGKTLTISHNHVVITPNGACPAGELNVGDLLQTVDGEAMICAIEHQPSYDGMMYNLAIREYQHPEEHDGNIATFIANDLVVGDINAQRALHHLRRNDIGWIKQRVPAYLHTDVESYFEDKQLEGSKT